MPEVITENKVGTKEQVRDLFADIIKEVSTEESERIRESYERVDEAAETDPSRSQLEKLFSHRTETHNRLAKETRKELGEKHAVGGVILCMLRGGGVPALAALEAEKIYGADSRVTKALQASDSTAGGFLLRDETANEVIELLRAESVVMSFNPRTVPLDSGAISFPKQTAGSSGSWIGEGSNLTHTAPTFGQVTLSAKKYGALVAISNDLLRYSMPDAERIVEQDLADDIAEAVDLAYIRGDGMAAQPKGLKNLAGNSLNANSTVTLSNVTSDLAQAIRLQLDDDVRIRRAGWIFAPRTWQYLFEVRDNNGNFVFQDQLSENSLFGFPWRRTSQIPVNLGGSSDQSEVYFVNWNDILVGLAQSLQIDVSNTAAYHNGSSVVSSFSRDETVVRAMIQTDINTRHDESITLVDQVTWGS